MIAAFVLAVFVTVSSTLATELATTPIYAVAEITFVGPRQSAADCPDRDIQLAATFRHESDSQVIKVEGFFDGDGKGGIDGDVFRIRFCPTRLGTWVLANVTSNAKELAGQHRGDHVTATLNLSEPAADLLEVSGAGQSAVQKAKRPGFWIPNDQCAGGRWYRRSDGSLPFIFGNTHDTFLTEYGLDGKPTGSDIRADIAGNASFTSVWTSQSAAV